MLKRITRQILLFAAMSLVLMGSLRSVAQDTGSWSAASTNAKAITGDISISQTKLTINLSGFTIAQIRRLDSAEVLAVFDSEAVAGGSGNLYRLNIPGSKRFLHHNTLCGSDDTQWMATYAVGHTLQIAFFSGSEMPVMTTDALAKSTDLCGTFSYAR